MTISNVEMLQIGAELERRLALGDIGITVLPKTAHVTIAQLREKFPTGPVVVCDCYIDGIEVGTEHVWGYEKDAIINIDHHAPRPIMCRNISAGVQSSIYVEDFGVVPLEVPVVVNHTDCDSVISSAIARGIIPPHTEFQRAVVCADHTGEPSRIAEVLQALEPAQDLGLSLQTLACLLQNQPLPPRAQAFVDQSQREAQLAIDAFMRGDYDIRDGVALLRTGQQVESSFVVPLFPDAAIVMNTYPRKNTGPNGEALVDVKVRLGQKIPDGVNLDTLGIKTFDPQFGGRWNAGSTSRAGGASKAPGEYLDFLAAQLKASHAP